MHYHLPHPIPFDRYVPASSPTRVPASEMSLPDQRDVSLCGSCFRICEEAIRHVGTVYSLRYGDLDDFVQDSWLAVLHSLSGGHYDPHRGRLVDWLHTIARNRAVTFFRRRWRTRNSVVDVPLDLLPCRLSEDPATILDRSHDIERVQQALELLEQRISPLGYAAFYLRQIQQQAVHEVAAALKLTDRQVRLYDHRARRKLASLLSCHRVC